jgi:hypothetical protein
MFGRSVAVANAGKKARVSKSQLVHRHCGFGVGCIAFGMGMLCGEVGGESSIENLGTQTQIPEVGFEVGAKVSLAGDSGQFTLLASCQMRFAFADCTTG